MNYPFAAAIVVLAILSIALLLINRSSSDNGISPSGEIPPTGSSGAWFCGQDWEDALSPYGADGNAVLRLSPDMSFIYEDGEGKEEKGSYRTANKTLILSFGNNEEKVLTLDEDSFTLIMDGKEFVCDETFNSFARIASQPEYYSVNWDAKPNYMKILPSSDGSPIGLEIKQYSDVTYYEWLTFYEWQSVEEQMSLRTPSNSIRLFPRNRKELLDEDGNHIATIEEGSYWKNFTIISSDGQDKWYCGKYGAML